MGTPFSMLLAPVNVSTGDGRRFAEGAITLAQTPFPLEWARTREGGHDGAVVVGVVRDAVVSSVADAVDAGYASRKRVRECGLADDAVGVWGRGELLDDVSRDDIPRLADDVAEAMLLLGSGALGPSVDLDDFDGMIVEKGTEKEVSFDDDEDLEGLEGKEFELLITRGRVRAATLVSIPAFAETSQLTVVGVDDGEDGDSALTASVVGSTDLPVADPGTEWDGAAAATRVFELHTGDDGTVDTEGVARAFLYRDPDADPATRGAYKLGYADVVDGELAVVPRGVSAVAGGRGVDATTGIPDAEKARIRERVCALYERIRSEYEDWPECPFADAAESSASIVATLGQGVVTHPVDVFDPPALSEPTPITYDWEAGRVYGHVAAWRTCHAGIPDVCVTPPHDADDGAYGWFHRYPVETTDGLVWAGRITVGGRHPSLTLTATATMAAYDPKRVVAYVRASEDEHGIVVTGVLADGIDTGTREILSRRTVSGDWRETAGGLSLVEVLALSPGLGGDSEPGFPVGVRSGRQVSLVATFGVPGGGAGPGAGPDGLTNESVRGAVVEALRSERARDRAVAQLSQSLRERSVAEQLSAVREATRTAFAQALPGLRVAVPRRTVGE